MEWISTSKDLPADKEHVLVWITNAKFWAAAQYVKQWDFFLGDHGQSWTIDKISHYCIPSPPKENKCQQ